MNYGSPHNSLFGPSPGSQYGAMVPQSPHSMSSSMSSPYLSAGHPQAMSAHFAGSMQQQHLGGTGARPRLLTSAGHPGMAMRGMGNLQGAGQNGMYGMGAHGQPGVLQSPGTPSSPMEQQMMQRQMMMAQQQARAQMAQRGRRGSISHPSSPYGMQDPTTMQFGGDHTMEMDPSTGELPVYFMFQEAISLTPTHCMSASYIMGDDYLQSMQLMPGQQLGKSTAGHPSMSMSGRFAGQDYHDFDVSQEIDMNIKMKIKSKGNGRGQGGMMQDFGMGDPYGSSNNQFGDDELMGRPFGGGFNRQRASTPF